MQWPLLSSHCCKTFDNITVSNFSPISYPFHKHIFPFGFQNKMLFWHNHSSTKCLLLHLLVLLVLSPGFNCGHPKAQTPDSLFSAWFYLSGCHSFSPYHCADNPHIYISSPDLSPELLPVIYVGLPLEPFCLDFPLPCIPNQPLQIILFIIFHI